jgi:hypothetical protein
MLKIFLPFLFFALLAAQFGCSSKTARPVPAPVSGEAAPDWVQECSVFQEEWYCGYGASKEKAIDIMVNQISVKVESEYTRKFEQTMKQETKEDVKKSETIIQIDKQKIKISTGSIEMANVNLYASPSGVTYAAVKKADVAKGFAEQLRPVAESMYFSANSAINEKHPKRKSEAWQKTQAVWRDFAPLLIKIEGLDKEKAAPFQPALELYARAREEYLGYCKSAKLYWNPEQNDIYSNIAFSRLSKNLDLTNAACNGHGISLVYKNTGDECVPSTKFRCFHKPSLLIASCYGEEYRLLENPEVNVYKNVKEFGIKELHKKLQEYESFWSDWEQEIKQWRPICE